MIFFFFFQAEDGIRDAQESRGLGDVYKRQVFVPIAFLGGLTGELYRQFSVTISIAVVISGFVALTLTPSLCVLILKRRHRPPGAFLRWFNVWFGRATGRYADGVAWMLRRGTIGILLFGGMVALTVGLWRITPTSLV